MPFIMQMAGFALLFVGVAIALWLSVWVLLFFFGVTVLAVFWSHVRDFLITKGILNPALAPDHEDEIDVTIVEGDFTRVEDKTKK